MRSQFEASSLKNKNHFHTPKPCRLSWINLIDIQLIVPGVLLCLTIAERISYLKLPFFMGAPRAGVEVVSTACRKS